MMSGALAPGRRPTHRGYEWSSRTIGSATQLREIARRVPLWSVPADRLREREHPDCSLVFLDSTQGRRRRWCSMQRCGNQMKVSGYRERRRERT
jgi:predicted RNA-binding Zn ribbon-like protein